MSRAFVNKLGGFWGKVAPCVASSPIARSKGGNVSREELEGIEGTEDDAGFEFDFEKISRSALSRFMCATFTHHENIAGRSRIIRSLEILKIRRSRRNLSNNRLGVHERRSWFWHFCCHCCGPPALFGQRKRAISFARPHIARIFCFRHDGRFGERLQ